MYTRLTDSDWASIRTIWEYDPDEPSFTVAGQRAAKKHGFKAPVKSSISRKAKAEAKNGSAWERRGSLSGINSAAHRKADTVALEESSEKQDVEKKETDKRNANATKDVDERNGVASKKEQASREESEDLRAGVIARHREEWKVPRMLLQESFTSRANGGTKDAFEKAKLAKITTEAIKIRQDGERKAWGLDDLGDFDPTKLSDAELDRIISGGR